jgi:hypothetical protein
MILEGAMMVVACGCMTVFHPGLCLDRYWRDPGSWTGKERRDGEVMLGCVGGEER